MNDLNMLLSCFREKMPQQGLLDDGDESRLKAEVSFLSFFIVFGPLLTHSLSTPEVEMEEWNFVFVRGCKLSAHCCFWPPA